MREERDYVVGQGQPVDVNYLLRLGDVEGRLDGGRFHGQLGGRLPGALMKLNLGATWPDLGPTQSIGEGAGK